MTAAPPTATLAAPLNPLPPPLWLSGKAHEHCQLASHDCTETTPFDTEPQETKVHLEGAV